ncbi:MAG: hypothetical protein AB2693_19870 [Candidatus Thiodiazotropha sp.]
MEETNEIGELFPETGSPIKKDDYDAKLLHIALQSAVKEYLNRLFIDFMYWAFSRFLNGEIGSLFNSAI